MYIENPGCVGDIEHNKYVDLLLKDILSSNISDVILKHLDGDYKTGNWIFDEYSQSELKKLNVIMRTKVITTLHKKILNFYQHLDSRNPIMKRLEKRKWVMLDELTKELEANGLKIR